MAWLVMSSISIIRLVLAITLLILVAYPSPFQAAIDQGYALLRISWFFQTSYFETIFTVISYSFFEDRYTRLFLRNPELRLSYIESNNTGANKDETSTDFNNPRIRHSEKRRPRMKRPSKRITEAILYIGPLLCLDFLLIKKYAGVNREDIMQVGGWTASSDIGPTTSSSFLQPSIHNFSISSPLQLVRPLPAQAPTTRRIILELIMSMIIYDTLFFFFHLSLHINQFLRPYHSTHHSHAEIHPQVTNQLHVVERMGLVLLANFSLNIIGSHVITRMVFIPIFTWLLVEIHSGMDLPLGYENILPSGWAVGARKHALHHKLGTSSYEPFFCWWDRLWEAVKYSR